MMSSQGAARLSVDTAPIFFEDKNPSLTAAINLINMGCNVLPGPYSYKAHSKDSPYKGFNWQQTGFSRVSMQPVIEDHALFNTFANIIGAKSNLYLMLGAVSGNLFIFDCENDAAFNYHKKKMQRKGIPIAAVKSGHGGHIYLRAKEGEVNKIALTTTGIPGTNILGDYEILGREGWAVAPPSLHPSGAIYMWIDEYGNPNPHLLAPPTPIPVVSIKDIDWLTNAKGDKLTLTVHKNSSPLPEKVIDYLENGTVEGRRDYDVYYVTKHVGHHHPDKSEAELHSIVAPQARLAGLPEKQISKSVHSGYQDRHNVQSSKASQDTRASRAKYSPMLEALDAQFDWKGTFNTKEHGISAKSARKLFRGFIQRFIDDAHGVRAFRASQRELELVADLSRATVVSGTAALTAAGLVEKLAYNDVLARFNAAARKENNAIDLQPPGSFYKGKGSVSMYYFGRVVLDFLNEYEANAKAAQDAATATAVIQGEQEIEKNEPVGGYTPHCHVTGSNLLKMNHQLADLSHPAFLQGAIGDNGRRVYSYLLSLHNHPDSFAKYDDIAAATGLAYHQVRYVLTPHKDKDGYTITPPLVEYGLVQKVGKKWTAYPADTSKLDQIARGYGTANKQETRKARHNVERVANMLYPLMQWCIENTPDNNAELVSQFNQNKKERKARLDAKGGPSAKVLQRHKERDQEARTAPQTGEQGIVHATPAETPPLVISIGANDMKMTTEQATELFRHHGLHVEEVNYKGFKVKMIKPSEELAQHWQARHEIEAVTMRISDAIAMIDDEIAMLKAKVGIAS